MDDHFQPRPGPRSTRKRSPSHRRAVTSVQVVASEESDVDSSDPEDLGTSFRSRTPRKKQATDFQQEVAEVVRHCIPEVVQAVVSNIGLQQSQDYPTNSPRVGTANNFLPYFPQGDVRPTPLSVSYHVPDEVKRKVLGGKFVHWYKLLPGFIDQDEGQAYVPTPREDGTLEFTVRASDRDKKLARKQLGIADFCRAFLKYKPIICHEFPNRHDELDAYVAYILDLYTRYQGNAYWLYHVHFTKRAASMWERGIRIKWSQIDPEVLHTAISVQQPSFCDHCQNFVHDTKACPFSVPRNVMVPPPVQAQLGPPAPGPLAGASQHVDPRAYYQGKQICDNFNYRSCKRGKDCKYLHVCRRCQKPDHTFKACPAFGEEM